MKREYYSKKHQHRAGFTLVEIIIVVSIIGILTMIATPNILAWFPHYRLKAASRELLGNMQKTRMNAIKENKDWAVVFDVPNNVYRICADDGADNDWDAWADNDIRETIDLSAYGSGVGYGHGDATAPIGVSFGNDVTFTTPDDVLIFTARGFASKDGYCYLKNEKDEACAVGALTSGSVRLRRWFGGAWQ